MRVKYCREIEIKEYEKMLAKVSNNGISIIMDEDGWTYGVTEEFGDVTDEIVVNLIEREINNPIDNIYVDTTAGMVIITSEV